MAKHLTIEHLEHMVYKPWTRKLTVHDKDPRYGYRLVRDVPEAIEYRKEMGYEHVPPEDTARTSSKQQPDGVHRVAGVYVLMRRPIEIHEAHLALMARKAEEKKRGPRDAFKEEARKLGVETEDRTKETHGPMMATLGEKDD